VPAGGGVPGVGCGDVEDGDGDGGRSVGGREGGGLDLVGDGAGPLVVDAGAGDGC